MHQTRFCLLSPDMAASLAGSSPTSSQLLAISRKHPHNSPLAWCWFKYPMTPLVPWLELPDPCPVAVLRCCAVTDPRTLLSAARAHSRLWQAAALVGLDSIIADIGQQERLDSLQLYLSKHGQHAGTITLEGVAPDKLSTDWRPVTKLRELPANLTRLHTVSFDFVGLQLQPGGGHRGVLVGAVGAHLTRLELRSCELLDGEEGLAAALKQLPGLEHLSMGLNYGREGLLQSSSVLAAPGLQQLTFLELASSDVHQSQSVGGLQHLTALTRLADLRLHGPDTVTAGMLAGARCLTRLQLAKLQYCDGVISVDPAVLAGVTQLQHLELYCSWIPDAVSGTAELLRQLQHLQQLTRLIVCDSLCSTGPNSPPAAADSALTASSKLQHLGITCCELPDGVWQHIFPADRQLPHLRALNLCRVHPPTLPAPFSRLVSCCPGLHTLNVSAHRGSLYETDILALAQLAGLRELTLLLEGYGVMRDATAHGSLLLLTHLKQLTALKACGHCRPAEWTSQAPGDEPVWRQLLWQFLNHSHPEVAQRAAAGLGCEKVWNKACRFLCCGT